MPAEAAASPATPDVKPALSAVPPLLTAVPRGDEPYVPPNSVFRMADAAAGDTYVPEWSGFADISDEVALSGVPVQLALTSAPSEPPIPVSADVFPILRGEPAVTPVLKEPAWKVEEPLAAPVDQLFPVAGAMPSAVAPAVIAPAVVTPPVVAPSVVAPPAVAVAPPAAPAESSEGMLSSQVFPVAAPTPVPQPAGESFPGLVPSAAPAAPAPTLFAEPPAPVAAPVAEPVAQPVAAPVAAPVAEPAAQPVPAPVAEPAAQPVPAPVAEPVAAPVAQPIAAPVAAPAPAPAPEPTIYTGPPPTEMGTTPVAPPDFQPFAASTPGATYVPLAPRPIPQPLQLSAPSAPATPSELVPVVASAPTEYWPTQGAPAGGGQYQPSPGDYVPFDPNAVHLEPVPVIPFSSRDPYNSASTARPGMRAYAAAPIGPTGSTWTGGLAFMLLAPILQAAAYFGWIQLVTSATISASTLPYVVGGVAIIGLLALASSQFDRNALAKRGYFDLASPFWVLLIPPLVYLIVRATRLAGQGKGAPVAIVLSLLSSAAAGALIAFAATPFLASLGSLSTFASLLPH